MRIRFIPLIVAALFLIRVAACNGGKSSTGSGPPPPVTGCTTVSDCSTVGYCLAEGGPTIVFPHDPACVKGTCSWGTLMEQTCPGGTLCGSGGCLPQTGTAGVSGGTTSGGFPWNMGFAGTSGTGTPDASAGPPVAACNVAGDCPHPQYCPFEQSTTVAFPMDPQCIKNVCVWQSTVEMECPINLVCSSGMCVVAGSAADAARP